MESPVDTTPKEIEKISQTILITGSEGRIGRIVAVRLSDQYTNVIGLDSALLETQDNAYAADIKNSEDVEDIFSKIGHIDAIVHLAGNPHPDDSFKPIFENNVIGTKHILDAAVKHGVKRIIIASSIHTVGGYEGYPTRLPADRPDRPMTTDDAAKGDGPYGWSKVEIEKMAKRYHEKYGLKTICLRFGFVTEDDRPVKGFESHWLSYRDTAQIVEKALISNVPNGVYFATSRIVPPMFDITSTIRDLGYKPRDVFRIKQ